MKYNNLTAFIFLIIFFNILLNINLVFSLGVASLYSGSDLPLRLSPGEEKIVILELQNWDIEGGVTMSGEILNGSEIASLKESSVKVPYQEKTPIEMVVKVPGDAKSGDIYNIIYEFKQIGGEGEGMVSFSQGIKRNFDVVIVGELAEEKGGLNIILVVLGIIILIFIVIILFVIRRKKTHEI